MHGLDACSVANTNINVFMLQVSSAEICSVPDPSLPSFCGNVRITPPSTCYFLPGPYSCGIMCIMCALACTRQACVMEIYRDEEQGARWEQPWGQPYPIPYSLCDEVK